MRASVTVLGLMLLCVAASAEIPRMISYQGKVTDTGGVPVADGNYTMRFRIYNAASGGTMLWDSGNRTISVAGGIFSVLLGESPQPALTLDFNDDYWLLVTFNGVDQSPRQRLASTGYAYMASGLVAGTEVSGSVNSSPFSAIMGTNTATLGTAYGVYGNIISTAGCGVYGTASSTSGTTYGVYGRSSSTAGRGVYGEAPRTSGTTNGVHGASYSNQGRGVYGHAAATSGMTYGVYGLSVSTDGRGVYGYADATSGITYGVYGRTESTEGRGVYGSAGATSGTTYGGSFSSSSTDGRGVYGHVAATSGTTYGVYGRTSSTEGRGVYGWAVATSGMTYGVYGWSLSSAGKGVFGEATATSGETYGGRFESSSTAGIGVSGHATASSGQTEGVFGIAVSTQGRGVVGWAQATTGTTRGVYGRSDSPDGHGVYYSGGLAGTGTKSCVVKTSQGPTLLYCQESPENWFEDFGEGQLVDGRCHIELDPLFLETVTIDEANPMKVFLQPQDPECEGLAAVLSESAFDAVELRRGTSGGRFTYRVVAKRKGFEAKRLDYCAAAERDSYLYPELREQERRELEEERARYSEERARMQEERRLESLREGMPPPASATLRRHEGVSE